MSHEIWCDICGKDQRGLMAKCRGNCEEQPAAESEWLDHTNGPGLYWMYDPCAEPRWQVSFLELSGKEVFGSHIRFIKIPCPTPPPAPLPRERQVTLTAKVRPLNGRYLAEVFLSAGPVEDRTSRWSSMPWNKDDCIKWVRDNYGLEPTVVEGEE